MALSCCSRTSATNGSYPAASWSWARTRSGASRAILDAWVYHIFEGRDVFIVTYGCHLDAATAPPVVSAEHSEVRLFAEDEVPGLNMPAGYKKSIATWFGRLREDAHKDRI
jgi:hypothetical protein